MVLLPSLRVLQLIPSLREGGTEQGTVDMALYIREQGGFPVVASSGGRWVKALEQAGIPHVRLSLQRKAPWWLLWNTLAICWLIGRYRIQLVHARSRAPAWSGWFACRIMFLTNVKFTTTFHGTYSARGWWKRAYNRVMLRGPRVIANSHFIRRHIVDTYDYPIDRIDVAPRGVDTEVFDPDRISASETRALKDALAGDAPLLLMVGRVTRWKGHEVLLRALAQVADLPWVLALAGDCKNTAYLNEMKALAAHLGLAERVRWLGPRQDIAALNMAADVAFSCSTQPEAFGRVAVEAMAMQTSVIASAHGGSLETVVDGTTGWLVPSGDEGALAAAIRNALANPHRLEAMGKAGRAHVLEHFTRQQTCAAEWASYQATMTA